MKTALLVLVLVGVHAAGADAAFGKLRGSPAPAPASALSKLPTNLDTIARGRVTNPPIAPPSPPKAPSGLPNGFENTREWYLKNPDKTAFAYAPIASGKASARLAAPMLAGLSTEPILKPKPGAGGLASLSTEPILRPQLSLDLKLLRHPAHRDTNVQSVGGVVVDVPEAALLRKGDKATPIQLSFALSNAKANAFVGPKSPGKLAVRVSSGALDARFGFEGEEHLHSKGTDHGGHSGVYTSMALPGVLSFASANLVRQGSTKDGRRTATFVLQGASLAVTPTREQVSQGVQPIKLDFDPIEITAEAVQAPLLGFPLLVFPQWWPFLRIKQRICVQPVRVAQRRCWFSWWGMCFFPYTKSLSGRGLAFGQPGVVEQWDKVDVKFNWRRWKTIYDRTGKYESVTSGAEETDLRAEVSDADCVEVFFVERFSPQNLHGGGATWGSGTANAKVITSDENVDCGIDLTHLAHELGHVVNIHHPGAGHATMADGTPGTLMCGSGWERDNPRRQSQENGDNAANPLLTNYVSLLASGTPDCTDCGDCGTCAAHLLDGPCV